MANQYMVEIERAKLTASAQALGTIHGPGSKWGTSEKELVEGLFRGLGSLNLQPIKDPQRRDMIFQILSANLNPLRQLRDEFLKAKKTVEASQADDIISFFHQQFKQMLRPRNEFYFGGSTSLEDSLDFMIWKHEADRPGIQLTPQHIA